MRHFWDLEASVEPGPASGHRSEAGMQDGLCQGVCTPAPSTLLSHSVSSRRLHSALRGSLQIILEKESSQEKRTKAWIFSTSI